MIQHESRTNQEFIPLHLLIPSLDNLPRLYFLYRQSARSGKRGARLRFDGFRGSRPPRLIEKIEAAFGDRPAKIRC